MKYLLDVNALLAFAVSEHEFHDRVADWIVSEAAAGGLRVATCSITEIGFVRIVAQTPRHGYTVEQAKNLLIRLKSRHSDVFSFLPDKQDIARLPLWVQHPKQVTDGHLIELAKSNAAALATLDRRIPGAFLIPA